MKQKEDGLIHGLRISLLIVAMGMSLYHLTTGFPLIGPPIAEIHYPIHVAFVLAIVFGHTAKEAIKNKRHFKALWNFLCLFTGLVSIGYIIFNADYVANRFNFATPLTNLETILGIGLILVTLEAARQTIGLVIVSVTLIFLSYAYFGYLLPEPFWISGFSISRIVELIYLTPEGIWNAPIRVSANFIFLFVLFACLLLSSGAGTFFSDLAQALTGRTIGGSAKTAVVASALMGMLSGSSTANAVTTGSFTIPAMKKSGYRPEFAAGVEAVASSGGQLMPPIMGTAAFLMIEFVGVSYLQIMGYAVMPAILYFFAVFVMVDLEARRTEMQINLSENLPKTIYILRKRGYLFLPVFIIMIFLFRGYTPAAAAFWAVVSVAGLVFIFDPDKRKNFHNILFEAMTMAPNMLKSVAMACVVGGIIAAIIVMAGLGLRISSIILDFSGGITILALFLTMIVAIILGMGMPTPGAYIILATLLAPGLVKMGIKEVAAHMFIIYCAAMSSITPPVAVTSFAAAAIAETNPWRTSWVAIKLALAIYIIPYMFVYGPSLLGFGSIPKIAMTTITAMIGIFTLSVAALGFFRIKLMLHERIIAFTIANSMIFPGNISDLIGISLMFLLIITVQIRIRRKKTERIKT